MAVRLAARRTTVRNVCSASARPGSLPDPERQRLLRSVFEPSPLDDVAEAVSVASQMEKRVYVERVDRGFRWSLTHPGGGYPLLRITARFLRVDHHAIVVGWRKLAQGVCVLSGDPKTDKDPDAWAILCFEGPATKAEVRNRIESALSPR